MAKMMKREEAKKPVVEVVEEVEEVEEESPPGGGKERNARGSNREAAEQALNLLGPDARRAEILAYCQEHHPFLKPDSFYQAFNNLRSGKSGGGGKRGKRKNLGEPTFTDMQDLLDFIESEEVTIVEFKEQVENVHEKYQEIQMLIEKLNEFGGPERVLKIVSAMEKVFRLK